MTFPFLSLLLWFKLSVTAQSQIPVHFLYLLNKDLFLGKYFSASPSQCVFSSADTFVCLLFVTYTSQRAHYQSSDRGVTVTDLYPHVQIHIPTTLLCLLPLPLSVPSVSIATGQNKLLIIGQGLSWQVVFNEICHILFQTGSQHTRYRNWEIEAVSFRLWKLFCVSPDAQSSNFFQWLLSNIEQKPNSSNHIFEFYLNIYQYGCVVMQFSRSLVCSMFWWEVPQSEIWWQLAVKRYRFPQADKKSNPEDTKNH